MTGYLSDVHEQPDALRRVADALPADLQRAVPLAERLRRGDFTSVIFTGMGSSLIGVYPATIILAEHGIPALAVETSELVLAYRSLLGEKSLPVAVSQSGQSAEIVRLVADLDSRVPLIGVTNTPDSPLAKHSLVVLPMYAGAEASVATKTYTCTLAVLHLLALTLTGQPVDGARRDIQTTADQLTDLLPAFVAQIPGIAQQIMPLRFIEYLGRGASRASAITAALITKETAKMPTEGMAGGQFRHGPWEMLAPDITVCIFAGARAARRLDLALAGDIVTRQGNVILIGPEAAAGTHHVAIPDIDPPLAQSLRSCPSSSWRRNWPVPKD